MMPVVLHDMIDTADMILGIVVSLEYGAPCIEHKEFLTAHAGEDTAVAELEKCFHTVACFERQWDQSELWDRSDNLIDAIAGA